MSPATYDVLCIGNAIVDIITRCDEAFLAEHDIAKAAMSLVEAERAERLYQSMPPAVQSSGGSAGNTAAGIASLGGRAAFFGKISDDQLGTIFAHDIRAQGVHFPTPQLHDNPPTARSMIFVTPDGERSMNTYLGACVEFGPADIDPSVVAGSKVSYFEGYLWDPPRAKEAIRDCARIALEHGREVAMSLSDAFCVERYRDEFLELMRSGTVRIVFANEAEAKALYQTADLDAALDQLAADCALAAVTLGAAGSLVIHDSERIRIEPLAIEELVDTTGAGDLFAAGFLHGYTRDRPLAECGRLGSLAAGLIVQHIGSRPQQSLAEAAREAGLG